MVRGIAAPLLIAAALEGVVAPALAQHAHKHGTGRTFDGPFVQGEADIALRFDGPVATNSSANEHNNLNVDVSHLQFGVFATPWLSLQAEFKGEPLRELRPGRGDPFRGFGIFTSQLYLDIDLDWASLFAGKIMPTFGLLFDHHLAWGLFSVDFTEDYETLDYLGAGFVLRGDFRDQGLGRHELTGQIFFADTSVLHRSIITAPRAGGSTVERQSRLRKSGGGVGNTEKLNNFSATLDSKGLDFLPDLGFHLGYRFLHRSPAGVAAGTETRNEHGISIALDYTFRVTDFILPGTTTIQPAVEWVRFNNFDGNSGRRTYWASNVIINNGDWTWHITGTLRNEDVPGTPTARDRLFATSLFHRFDERWQIGAGYKFQRVRDQDTGKHANDHVVGLKVIWSQDFAFGLK